MTTDTPITAAAYADLVRAELADLGPDDLASMVEGLDAHLAEIAADGQADLAAALGSPAAYATELRSAAGLAAKAPVATGGAPQLQPSDRPRLPARVAAARAVVALALAFAVYAVIAADPCRRNGSAEAALSSPWRHLQPRRSWARSCTPPTTTGPAATAHTC